MNTLDWVLLAAFWALSVCVGWTARGLRDEYRQTDGAS